MAFGWNKYSKITFLNASRVHTVFAKPWMAADSCVTDKNIKNVRCISMENEYHRQSQTFSLNTLNWWVTFSPSWQTKKMRPNEYITFNAVFVTSAGDDPSAFFENDN